jgi:hypothetical protein
VDPAPGWVEVTHPFHPLRGQRFELVAVRRSRHGDRVWVRWPDGSCRTFPRAWTSLADADPWRDAGRGRALFRVDDLGRLAVLVQALRAALDVEAGQDV